MENVGGVLVDNRGAYDLDEVKRYIEYVRKETGKAISDIQLIPKGEQVEINYTTIERKFERIRRVTGYLVGTMDRWNNSKQAEEHDRVKHA